MVRQDPKSLLIEPMIEPMVEVQLVVDRAGGITSMQTDADLLKEN